MTAGRAPDVADDRRDRFCIIGAGPSGLAVAREFSRRGIAFELLERHGDVGGIWDPDNPGTPMYDTAHFISSRTLSGFDGFPMPDDYPDYPGWRQVLRYVRAFAEATGVRAHAEFGVAVTNLRPLADGAWEVAVADRAPRAYRGVVIATGHDWIPNEATVPGTFAGEAYHSRDYWSPREFQGKRVLVVGGGNSGYDIAGDAATHADRAFISVRRGYHVLPKHIFGKPIDVFFRSGPQPHARIAQPILALILRLTVGDLARYGLPKPDHKPLESHPLVNSQLLHHLAHGNITPKPDVVRLAGHAVHFADGSTEDVDVIVWATGYRHDIPLLAGLGADGAGQPLFANMFVPGHRTLFVAGHFESDGGAYPLVSKQAALFADIIQHAERDPGTHARLERLTMDPAPDLSGGIRHLATQRHDIALQSEAYERWMTRARKAVIG